MSTPQQFHAFNPATNEPLEDVFVTTTTQELDRVVHQATIAFETYRKKDKNEIALFLEQIAEEIINLGEPLLTKCHLETALPIARLQGERGRTVAQLQLFAQLVREGSWVEAKIDTAQPNRTPLPKSDIRQMLVPLGPVAVFGASNFPLAFSVAGGDTASALAAGCPVIFKGHPAHPGTSAMVATAFEKAIEKCGMPKGTFALVQGHTNELGANLVQHPAIKAVGFTGSFTGGKALFDLANTRPEPIPVYAEMGSTNPVFILPEILKEKATAIATGMAQSIAQGVGQFCTNPGLAFIIKSEEAETYCKELCQKINETPAGTMLTEGISKAYQKKIAVTNALAPNIEIAKGQTASTANAAVATVFKTSLQHFLENPLLAEENFGPSQVLVEAHNKEEILEAAKNLEGHLTATVHGTMADLENYKDLVRLLELKVGRIVINGFPTGVEVCHAMVHGGPYPATTAPQSTSVGTQAIKRFVRPVCFQDYPSFLLPEALKDENPNQIWRLIDGEFSKKALA
ncbi:aldehyde dehydrogenase (NADP(+)) [Flavobacterium sp. UMI-01]|uniref:aldehyde dehydrogenase (NADP(+)) n=1 Tax=Flavobacterium sp. UMI-01 TaxID=1441053 RepID=UPI00177446A5|nr:aldehyde dehydrogenase (NADP(+)) [Flavobacterium sp. UMI-01]BBU94050.1 alpha-KGSA dehydrogenase [Flavobacterium sp. UMI-01]GIZ07831.1 fatty aldehyde dehydrogenase [Flavobacterium sp. UMI-01]